MKLIVLSKNLISKKLYKIKGFLFLIPVIFFAFLLVSLDFVTFDASNHIFFAKHYKNDWFSLIDYQLAGGLDLSTYPPLVFQLMAIFSFFLNLTTSYYLILIIFWFLLSYFSTKFFVKYLELDHNFFNICFCFVFFSIGIIRTIFLNGQITTLVGLAFGFISLSYLLDTFESKNLNNFILFGLSLALVLLSHHLSFILIFIAIVMTILLNFRKFIKNINYYFLTLLIFSLVILLGLFPFYSKVISHSLIPENEIYSPTRYPLEKNNFYVWYFGYLGIVEAMLLFPIFLYFAHIKNKRVYHIYFFALVFYLIGLGRTTPLTKILFLEYEHWLTYERFLLFASIAFSFLLALFLYYFFSVFHKLKHKTVLMAFIIILYIIFNLSILLAMHEMFFRVLANFKNSNVEKAINYSLDFLNKNVSEKYRYQTFGLSTPPFSVPIGEIYLHTKIPTLDTDYFGGRTIDWQKNSGLNEIDRNYKNFNFLELFMNNTSKYSIKYIITFNQESQSTIKKYNWNIIANNTFGNIPVTIWENSNEIEPISQVEEKITIANYLWGIVPLATLFIFLISMIYNSMKKH